MPVKDIRQGFFHTGVLTRYCGLAATLPRDALKQEASAGEGTRLLLEKLQRSCPNGLLGKLFSKPRSEWRPLTHSSKWIFTRALRLTPGGMCRRGKAKESRSWDIFPFLPQRSQKAKALLLGDREKPGEGDLSEADADHLIPQADVVAITGLPSPTIHCRICWSLCNPEAYIVMLGDTVPPLSRAL